MARRLADEDSAWLTEKCGEQEAAVIGTEMCRRAEHGARGDGTIDLGADWPEWLTARYGEPLARSILSHGGTFKYSSPAADGHNTAAYNGAAGSAQLSPEVRDWLVEYEGAQRAAVIGEEFLRRIVTGNFGADWERWLKNHCTEGYVHDATVMRVLAQGAVSAEDWATAATSTQCRQRGLASAAKRKLREKLGYYQASDAKKTAIAEEVDRLLAAGEAPVAEGPAPSPNGRGKKPQPADRTRPSKDSAKLQWSARSGWNGSFRTNEYRRLVGRAGVAGAMGRGVAHTFVELIDVADDDGRWVIKHRTLARYIGIWPSTIKEDIRKLQKLGLVRVIHRSNSMGNKLANQYEILPFDEERVRGLLGLPSRPKPSADEE